MKNKGKVDELSLFCKRKRQEHHWCPCKEGERYLRKIGKFSNLSEQDAHQKREISNSHISPITTLVNITYLV